MHPNVETFIGCDSSYRAASIVLYGAPYDSTTSYRPGARFGPAAIRHESYGLETYSPYQNADLTDFDVFDSGDLELCFGSSELALADIEARAEEILKDGKFPLLLGGEHLVTLGAVRAAVKKYPDLHIVHFDAHADLRDDYLGAKLSHACVLRRCHELVGDGHIHQFCIRSGDRAEFEFAAQHTEMHKFDFTGLAELTAQLCESKVPVYLTIDLDCLDPSCFPGTGTPEAGGVSFLQLLEAIRTVTKANIIGADLNELAPTLDTTGVSTATACKVLRETLIALDKGWVILGGYSLAGLFSLWSAAQVDDFAAVAAVSPSVWFPGWRAYADQHALRSRVVYLSLGDREERSRNPVLASVGDAIRREDARLSERGVRHTLQWNAGNHFQDAEKRCADGFAWCMAQRKAGGEKNT